MLKCPALPIRYTDLMKKEVVNVYDGCKLGYVYDLELDTLCGRINSIFVARNVFSKKKDCFIIKWEQIERLGCDTVLVRLSRNEDKKS